MISFTKGTTFCGNVQACRERKWSSISALAALCSGQYTLVKNPAIFCQGVPDLRLLNAFWGHLDKKTRISLSR